MPQRKRRTKTNSYDRKKFVNGKVCPESSESGDAVEVIREAPLETLFRQMFQTALRYCGLKPWFYVYIVK